MATDLFTVREIGPALRFIVESKDGRTVQTFGDFPESVERGNAKLIAEAFNVTARTGKTPEQLETENAKLRNAVQEAISTLDYIAERGDGQSVSKSHLGDIARNRLKSLRAIE